MTTALSLTPLFRQSVGFDRFNDLFQTLVSGEEQTGNPYPPYNIEKRGEESYAITMALAGFGERDLTITVQNDWLRVAGRIEERKEEGVEYLHRGIATRAFERTFRLADHLKVVGAELKDGLLRIQLKREVPEEAKPRMIPINGVEAKPTIEGKAGKK
jgi:molecular chaperone IbpA